MANTYTDPDGLAPLKNWIDGIAQATGGDAFAKFRNWYNANVPPPSNSTFFYNYVGPQPERKKPHWGAIAAGVGIAVVGGGVCLFTAGIGCAVAAGVGLSAGTTSYLAGTQGRSPSAGELVTSGVIGGATGGGSTLLGRLVLSRFAPGVSTTGPTVTNIGRVFRSPDEHVADVANAIEASLPGRVVGVNTKRGMNSGSPREIDIDLGNLLVQVKGGNARGLTGQILRTESSTGVPTIGYAPGISDAAWRNAASEGIPILRSPGELLSYIKEFG